MAQNVTITLTVDIDKLAMGKGRPSRRQVVRACKLSDDNNGKPSGNGCLFFFIPTKRVKNFTSIVDDSSNINWVGETGKPGYSIVIDSIVYRYSRNSINFFNDIVLRPTNPGDVNVKKTVVSAQNLDEYAYIINFKVKENAGSNELDLQIDPRLKMHTRAAQGDRQS